LPRPRTVGFTASASTSAVQGEFRVLASFVVLLPFAIYVRGDANLDRPSLQTAPSDTISRPTTAGRDRSRRYVRGMSAQPAMKPTISASSKATQTPALGARASS